MKIAVIGGHMAPALGFITNLPNSTEVVYIGRTTVFEGDAGESLEQKTVKKMGIRFVPFQTGRVQRVLTKQTFPSLLKVPKGFLLAVKLLKKEKPDAVVGFGGYVSVPLGIAAKLLHIPLIIHESTLGAGLANKILSPFADTICISWDSSQAFFPKNKTILTGNPLLPGKTDKEIPFPESKEKLPLLVISGGSGGSHSVNVFISQLLPEIVALARVFHITGDAKEFNDFDMLTKQRENLSPTLQKRYKVVKFVDPLSIATVFGKADLVIGRSGINTIMTLLLLKKKAILIPLPTGQKNEQYANAKLMESFGLATILPQSTLSPKILFSTIQDMLSTKTENPKWEVPVVRDGGKNLVQEVIKCVSASQKEE